MAKLKRPLRHMVAGKIIDFAGQITNLLNKVQHA